MSWHPGYVDCPGFVDCDGKFGAGDSCDRICPVCGAPPGKIGIGCLECECCIGDPDQVI
jgi:hypothetical protein